MIRRHIRETNRRTNRRTLRGGLGMRAIEQATEHGRAPAPPLALTRVQVTAAVDAAARRYLDKRRENIPAFVDATYSFGASLALHRHALGWDIARAPLNAALALPQVATQGLAAGLKPLGHVWRPAAGAARRLEGVTLIRPTDVGRELTFRLFRDFLELPMAESTGPSGRRRQTLRDALAAEILADPEVGALARAAAQAVADRRDDPAFRARLDATLAAYVGSRAAAADLVNALVCAGTGMALASQATPGTWGLSTLLAGVISQKLALASFPLGGALGSTLGGLWYGLVPAAVPGAVLAASAATVMTAAAVVGAFAGVVADPVQRRLGLHHRRLSKLVDSLEADLLPPADQDDQRRGRPLVLRDHYVARVFDLADLLATAHRLALAR